MFLTIGGELRFRFSEGIKPLTESLNNGLSPLLNHTADERNDALFMIKIKFFDRRTDEAAMIRQTVFIEEQGFQSEFDETDKVSMHLVLYNDGIAAGTGRMFTEDGGKSYHLGRIAVLPEYRHLHLGSEIVNAMCRKAKELGAEFCVLSAQCRVKEFYKSMGFEESGDVYFDEYCPHIHMEKKL